MVLFLGCSFSDFPTGIFLVDYSFCSIGFSEVFPYFSPNSLSRDFPSRIPFPKIHFGFLIKGDVGLSPNFPSQIFLLRFSFSNFHSLIHLVGFSFAGLSFRLLFFDTPFSLPLNSPSRDSPSRMLFGFFSSNFPCRIPILGILLGLPFSGFSFSVCHSWISCYGLSFSDSPS